MHFLKKNFSFCGRLCKNNFGGHFWRFYFWGPGISTTFRRGSWNLHNIPAGIFPAFQDPLRKNFVVFNTISYLNRKFARVFEKFPPSSLGVLESTKIPAGIFKPFQDPLRKNFGRFKSFSQLKPKIARVCEKFLRPEQFRDFGHRNNFQHLLANQVKSPANAGIAATSRPHPANTSHALYHWVKHTRFTTG